MAEQVADDRAEPSLVAPVDRAFGKAIHDLGDGVREIVRQRTDDVFVKAGENDRQYGEDA